MILERDLGGLASHPLSTDVSLRRTRTWRIIVEADNQYTPVRCLLLPVEQLMFAHSRLRADFLWLGSKRLLSDPKTEMGVAEFTFC